MPTASLQGGKIPLNEHPGYDKSILSGLKNFIWTISMKAKIFTVYSEIIKDYNNDIPQFICICYTITRWIKESPNDSKAKKSPKLKKKTKVAIYNASHKQSSV